MAAACVVDFYRGRKPEGIFLCVFGPTLIGSGVMLGITPFGAETEPGTLNMLLGGYSPIRFGLCFYSLMLLALAICLQNLSELLGWVIGRAESPSKEGGETPPIGIELSRSIGMID